MTRHLLSPGCLLPGLLVKLVEAGGDALAPPAVRTGRPQAEVTRRASSTTEIFVAPGLGALQEELLTDLTQRDEIFIFARSLSLANLASLLSLLLLLVRSGGEILLEDAALPQEGHPAGRAGRECLGLGRAHTTVPGLDAGHAGVGGLRHGVGEELQAEAADLQRVESLLGPADLTPGAGGLLLLLLHHLLLLLLNLLIILHVRTGVRRAETNHQTAPVPAQLTEDVTVGGVLSEDPAWGRVEEDRVVVLEPLQEAAVSGLLETAPASSLGVERHLVELETFPTHRGLALCAELPPVEREWS